MYGSITLRVWRTFFTYFICSGIPHMSPRGVIKYVHNQKWKGGLHINSVTQNSKSSTSPAYLIASCLTLVSENEIIP